MMTGGMSCGKTFRSTEPQVDKKTVLTERDKATQSRRISQSVYSKIMLFRMLSTVFASDGQLRSESFLEPACFQA